MKYPGTESAQLEFKREIPKNEQIVKTIIGFCNRDGGRLIIGIDDDGTYIRLAKHTAKASADIIQELEWQSRGLEFESMAVYKASMEDIDHGLFDAFLESRKNHGKTSLSDETLKAYSMIAHEHTKTYPTTLAILLFGRESQLFFTEAMIICSHFQGTRGRETIATIDCIGTLFNQFKQAYAFVLSRLNRSFTIDGLKRDEKLEIPEVAIRETY